MNIRLGALVATAVTLSDTRLCAQGYEPPSGSLFELREGMEARLNVMRGEMTEAEFYAEGGEYTEFQRWFEHWYPRLMPHGDFDAYDQIIKGYCELKHYDGSSYCSNQDPWLELGPKRRSNSMIGIGPIRHISINKQDPDHMLCSSNSGGLFYTTNASGNCTWQNAGTDLGWPRSGCRWAEYYPNTTDSWYALATGERIGYVGGVYRTTNSGGHWDRIGDYEQLGGPTTQVRKLLFDRKSVTPQSQNRLFVASTTGLYVCDHPATLGGFGLVAIPPPPSLATFYPGCTIDPVVNVHDVEYLPQFPTSVLCATVQYRVTTIENDETVVRQIWRVMVTNNDGVTWTEATNHPDPDPDIIAATVETSAQTEDVFYCHAVKGSNQSWVKSYDTGTHQWTNEFDGFTPGFGGGYSFAVDQFDATSILVGKGINARWYLDGSIQESTVLTGHDDVEYVVFNPNNEDEAWVGNHGGVYRMDLTADPPDWEDKSDGLGVAEVWSLSTSQNKPDYVAVGLYHDCNQITRTPYGADWDPEWDYLPEYGDGTLVLVDPKDANVVYWAVQPQPEGSITADWNRADFAETSLTANHEWDNYPTQYYSRAALNRIHSTTLYRTTLINNGQTPWFDMQGNPQSYTNNEIEIKRSFDKGLIEALVSDFANNSDVGGAALFDSEPGIDGPNDYKVDWEAFDWIRASPANRDHLYVGLRNHNWQNRVYRNTQINGQDVQAVKNAWVKVPHPRMYENGNSLGPGGGTKRDAGVAGIAMDPENENIIYIAYTSSYWEDPDMYDEPYGSKMVFRMDVGDLGSYPSTGPFDCGGGVPCTDLTMNLPNTLVDQECIAFEQGSDGGLYVATEAGVYFTDNKRIAAYNPTAPEDADDLGNSSGWVRLGGALPHVPTHGLEINYQINRIRAGLVGRGVWEHALHCPATLDFDETGTYTDDAFLEAENTITSEAIVPTGLEVNYRAGEVVHLTPGFRAQEGAHFHAFIHPCDLQGNSFKPKNSVTEGDVVNTDAIIGGSAELTLYPNPAQDQVMIQLRATPSVMACHARLYDSRGQLIRSEQMLGPLHQMRLPVTTGLYTVVVAQGVNLYRARLVIY